MRLLKIRANTGADAECLMRELAAYAPTLSRRSVVVELERIRKTVRTAVPHRLRARRRPVGRPRVSQWFRCYGANCTCAWLPVKVNTAPTGRGAPGTAAVTVTVT